MWWPFLLNPWLAALVALTLLGIAMAGHWSGTLQGRHLTIAAALWGGYAIWEWYCNAQGANIRVDLLLLTWLLPLSTLTLVILEIRRGSPRQKLSSAD